LYDFSALQQVSKIFCSIGYDRLRNKPKSIKIIAKSSSKNIFRWSLASYQYIDINLYFAFDNVFLNKKNVEKNKKTLKNVKNVT